MTDRPAPLTPSGCDLSGNDWFPLYFDRLRKSKWWRRASDLARARNVMLWGEAYKAVPAGSLADDDDDLAEAAGFGFDVEAFVGAKDEIMAPWVLCSDGRWYHPTVCEAALDAWSKLGEKRRADRERKAAHRASTRSNPQSVTAENDGVTRDNGHVTPDTPEKPRDEGTHTGETGEDRKEADASLSPDGNIATPEEQYPKAFTALWEAYPHVRGRTSRAKSYGAWRRLPKPHHDLLPAAAARFTREGREPKADCGAAGLHVWLKDRKYEDWLAEPSTAQTKPMTPERWRTALAMHRESGQWWEVLGPRPGQPGCRAPPELVLELAAQPRLVEISERGAA